MRKASHQQHDWSGSIESLEDRLVMSADPLGGFLGGRIQHHAIVDEMPAIEHHALVDEMPALEHHASADELPALGNHLQPEADFWLDSDNLRVIDEELERIEQSLANAHDQSGLSQVRADYGFDGTGQTVAIIDSGIAYDHFALGGGLGSNYRVVGGWDFTGENDADPYDDGGAGSHGTHVSGIVGASGGTHDGVAPGVDLVGLRVFDDAGNGYFTWVENALRWIHDNRNSFENPITAVNLSLGVASWNSDSIPSWANLEDEFQQLEQAGIFISVSAGNSYTTFNSTGLSYPAASPYVVPVASVDDNGSLSYYSQRNSRVIAAPGRGIISTVPDYAGNNNGVADDYASFSGTSMAAPYVAGASVIIRQAMEFVGYTNITQDMIYNHMIATADTFYDSATDANYNRLNLESAIDALMPADDYGSTVGAAYNLGSLSNPATMNGAITTLDDVDYFKFTAAGTGTVTFTASNMTHDVAADWTLAGGTGTWSGANNEIFTIDVVGGQEYTVGFSSDNGLGYYDLNITSEAGFTYTDWGAISYSTLQGVSVSNETWYRAAANSAGYFTAQALFDAGGNQVHLELYNSNMELIDTGNAAGGISRVDTYASAGEELFLKAIGTNGDVDFRLTNLVSTDGTTVNVAGTAGDDAFAFTAGGTNHYVSVNGVTYGFSSVGYSNFNISGDAGEDSITLRGTTDDETVTLRPGSATLAGNGFTTQVNGVENAWAIGGGGNDIAYVHDSVGDDVFIGTTNYSYMTGTGFYSHARDFHRVYAISAAGGSDFAFLYDSAGDDNFYGYESYAYLTGSGFYNYASNFERVYSVAIAGGHDEAYLYDTAGEDIFIGRSNYAYLRGDSYYNYASRFDRVYAVASSGGYDEAYLYDSASNDNFYGRTNYSYLRGDGFYNYASSFDRVYAIASGGGYDQAYLYDSSGDDYFYGKENFSYLFGSGFYNYASSFDRVYAIANGGGYDQAYLYDSVGDDDFYGRENYSYLRGSNFYNYASSFDRVYAIASAGGTDRAYLFGSAQDDDFYGRAKYSYFRGNGFYNYAANFDQVFADASEGGIDRAYINESSADTLLNAGAAISSGSLSNFDNITATNNSGAQVHNDVGALDYVFSQL